MNHIPHVRKNEKLKRLEKTFVLNEKVNYLKKSQEKPLGLETVIKLKTEVVSEYRYTLVNSLHSWN